VSGEMKLLPCPFCGNEHPDYERVGTPRQSCIVACGNCGCRHESGDEGEHNGSSWNTRASPPPPEDGWKPIESAPKDGTRIMLSNGKDVAEGWWVHDEGGITEHRDLDGRYIGQDESEGYIGWLDFDGGMLPEPTHYRPLPPPPAALEPKEQHD